MADVLHTPHRTAPGPGVSGKACGENRSRTPDLGPGTRKVERYTEIHFGVVDAGAGPTPILTKSDELRMNHDHLSRKYVHLADAAFLASD